MLKKVLSLMAVAAVVLMPSALAAADSGSMATAFAVQNLGDGPATVSVDFYNTSGVKTNTLSPVNSSGIPITLGIGENFNFDQRYDSGDPGTDTFQGSAIVQADQPVGAAANMMRTGGDVPAYESYNALDMSAVGQDLLLPQLLKNVSSGGLVYNTTIVIQNTDTENAANVEIVFTPDPVLNAAVGGTKTTAYTYSVTIPKGGSAYIDQTTTPSAADIGAIFFGSGRVIADRDVAPVVYNDGSGQQLLALPSYAAGSTDPIALPSIFKNISSFGLDYNTAILLVNFGDQAATVEIAYMPIVGTASTVKDTVTVPAKAALNVDQRYNSPGITSATFMGAAEIQSTNGQPVAAMVNLRGGPRYAMTYGGVMGGGTVAYIPISYKDVASGGYSWSSTVIVQNLERAAGNASVKFTFYPSGASEIADATAYSVTGVKQFDLRYTTAIGAGGTSEQSRFIGALKVESASNKIGVMVQTRGTGGSGDSMMAFLGLMP